MTIPKGVLPHPRAERLREALITTTAFALFLLGGVVRGDESLTAPPVAAYLLAVVSCAALPLRHRTPLPVMVVTTVCGVLAMAAGLMLTPLVVVPAMITAYTIAVRAERRTTTTVLLISAALLMAMGLVSQPLSWSTVTRTCSTVIFPLAAGVLGHSTQNRRAYLAAMEERALRAEESRESEARRRVAEERVRIARELHDLVAHEITLANAQATVAAHFFDSRPEQTRTSLRQLVETTRQALDELRATVGLLRQSGDRVQPAEPAPGLAQLPTLIESFRRAGLTVSVHEEGPAGTLPPGLDLTAYRIIQEALTNVTKHAGTGRARVGLAWSRDLLTLTITDDGPGDHTVPGLSAGSGGFGLIGMRERAAAVGGRLVAGRRPEGGFRVVAELPRPARDTPRGAAAADGERQAGVMTTSGRSTVDAERPVGEPLPSGEAPDDAARRGDVA
ncbi:two-component sensor histidine kinase [Microbispora rosea subsp. aerata]|nr:sensor histidine kinase [Microbispora rosea]GGO26265.1 two-component sensor histidine kinase [Microbispora rosea subsp. aerata]GIH54186.1 two-component sensor histidine kinase [Microbispora rosea subsp. aerata]GLJ85596.1 two-component sensor histidine kinase [Microbispora rosea subsp. aerata]